MVYNNNYIKEVIIMLMYTTEYGEYHYGDTLDLLNHIDDDSVQLLLTSPPFPQVKERNDYLNPNPNTYVDWLLNIVKQYLPKLTKTGSIVIELGHVYNHRQPTLNIYNYEFIYRAVKELNLHLCFQFFFYNPSSLPSPTAYCNRMRIRPKNSVSLMPWLSLTPKPYADTNSVLKPYSKKFKKLLKLDQITAIDHNTPSGHYIHNDTWKNNGGSIPTNLLQYPNSTSKDKYLYACKLLNKKPHSARMPLHLAEWIIKYLTKPGDLVIDTFGGSNTTGFAAESLKRHWKTIDNNKEFISTSSFRFINDNNYLEAYNSILNKPPINLHC